MRKIFFVFIRRKNGIILPSEIKCPKSGIFTNNYWMGWLGQSNFASIAVFFQALSKIFSGKDGSAPLEKIGPYAYVYHSGNYCKINKLMNSTQSTSPPNPTILLSFKFKHNHSVLWCRWSADTNGIIWPVNISSSPKKLLLGEPNWPVKPAVKLKSKVTKGL